VSTDSEEHTVSDDWAPEEQVREMIDIGAFFDVAALDIAVREQWPDDMALQNVIARAALAWVCKTMSVTIQSDGHMTPWLVVLGNDQSLLRASYSGACGMAWDVVKNWPGNPLDIAPDTPLWEVERKVLEPIGLGVRYEEDPDVPSG